VVWEREAYGRDRICDGRVVQHKGLFAVPVRCGSWCAIRKKFKTHALLLCTDLEADPERILSRFVMRWQMEVTFQEVRRHLGFETHR
jgi:hypothetical protein